MKKILTYTIIMFSSITMLFSQGNNTVKNKALNSESQAIVGNNYQYFSFTILDLNSENERQEIINYLNSNANLKNFEISEHNQVNIYVDKDYISQFKEYFNENNYKTTMVGNNKKLGPNDGTTKIIIPENMKPTYVDTGNPEEDKKRYTEAKKQLLIEHPEFIQ